MRRLLIARHHGSWRETHLIDVVDVVVRLQVLIQVAETNPAGLVELVVTFKLERQQRRLHVRRIAASQ